MANSIITTILQDGPRNTRIKVTGILDTSDLAYTVIANPATLSFVDQPRGLRATQLRVNKIDYDVEDGLDVRVLWGNTVPANAPLLYDFVGRGMVDNDRYNDWNNTQAAGFDGTIAIATQGWSTGGIYEFSLTFTLVKQNPNAGQFNFG